MKNNRGITLISLTMYVVAFAILAGIIVTITSFFHTNVTELSEETNSLGEFEKFNAVFLEEVKKADVKVVGIENEGRKIIFTSGAIYFFEQAEEGIYTNNIKMCEGVKECIFSIKENAEKPTIRVYLEIGNDFAKTLDYVMNSNEVMYEEIYDRVTLMPNKREWVSEDITVTLSCENIPKGYDIQYKIGDEEWTTGTVAVVKNNNTIVRGRLYDANAQTELGTNNIFIDNIDKEKPTDPTNAEVETTTNSIIIKGTGGTDALSGVAGYQYSLNNTDWSETIKTDSSYTFSELEVGTYTVHIRTIDNVGLISNSTYSLPATLVIPVTGVTLNKSSTSIIVGASETLIATVEPNDATNKDVTWESSNTNIATVTSAGVVTGVAGGTATITVTTADGSKTATCSVTVNVPVTGVTLNKSSITLNAGSSETLTATIAPSNASNKNVSWKSSNTSVATVTSAGKVTGVASGTATITVTTADGSKTAKATVTCKERVKCTTCGGSYSGYWLKCPDKYCGKLSRGLTKVFSTYYKYCTSCAAVTEGSNPKSCEICRRNDI